MAALSTSPPAWLEECVVEVPDFPSPGILFRDFSPLWTSSSALSRCAVALAAGVGTVDVVAGIEARGFLAGIPVAQRLGLGFVAIRKPGKLPGPVFSASYELEYGSDTLELQQESIEAGQRVLLVDDLIATGGTLTAAIDLVEQARATVVGIRAIMEFTDLGAQQALDGYPVTSLWETAS